ncbi:MAG: SLATT domain-containing protein [Gammaproteobacteria bacterium]
MGNEQNTLLSDWYRRVRRAQIAYTRSAARFERLHYYLGLPTVVLSAFVATSIFTTNLTLKSIALLASVIAAILAGLQTFLRFSERAERLRVVGAEYGSLRREIEQKLNFPPKGEELEKYTDFNMKGSNPRLSGGQISSAAMSGHGSIV